MASAGRGTGKRGLSSQFDLREILRDISPVELNKLFIEQQQLYNQYVPLTIDCHGPLLQLTDYYDCFRVFQGPTVTTTQEQDSLNITGHFQFHSGLIVKKMPEEDVTAGGKVNGIHVTLDDYVDFLEPFRRSSNLNIRGNEAGWKIDDDQRVPQRGLSSFFPSGTKNPNLLRTDGFVNIVKLEQDKTQRSQVPFHNLLSDNIDVFDSFQNNVNIVTGHNLSPALIDEHSLLFIHDLLTKPYSGDRNRRLGEIVAKLNRTHKSLVEVTENQIIDDIANFGLTPEHYLPEHLKKTDSKDRIPERLFAISVAQLSSRATFSMMGYRYFLSGYSCVGITDEDKYKCDPDQPIITDKSLIPLMESLAFTLTFRVDMVYNGNKYFFSLILDRNELNDRLDTTTKKGVFKQYELYKDILHDSFQGCIVGALDRFATTTASAATTAAAKDAIEPKDAIKHLWPGRTFDLIQNGCASIDHCMTLGKTPMLDKLYLQFHTKESNTDVITLRPNPFDRLTKLENIISHKHLDPVVNVHLHFPKIRNVLQSHLSVPPDGGAIVGWSQTVNEYDENIIERLLAQSQGSDWKTASLFGSQSQSRSPSLSISSAFTASSQSDMTQQPSVSVERGVPYGQVTQGVVGNIGHVNIEERIGDFLRSHENDSIKSTQNPIDDCEAQQGDAPRVGYFTQFRTALVDLVKKIFKRPSSDTEFDMGGGSLHKNPRRTKTHTRRNKKYSRKKARHYNTYVKTRIKRRRRATYKK